MGKELTKEELKIVFGDLIVNGIEYIVQVDEVKEGNTFWSPEPDRFSESDVKPSKGILLDMYVIYALDPVLKKEIQKVIILKKDTANYKMVARKKVLLIKLIQREE